MTSSNQNISTSQTNTAQATGVLEQALLTENIDVDARYARFVMAVLGSFTWVGGVISAAAALKADGEQGKTNQMQMLWLQEHSSKIKEIELSVAEIIERFKVFGDEINERIQSPEFLSLVKSTFQTWDKAETQEKKQMLRKLITNAAVITLSTDDLVQLFIKWIDQYHEFHFMVMREIYRNPGISRGQIWDNLKGERPREDSPEADLFRLLIDDLSQGRVIRQARETDNFGNFLRQNMRGPRQARPATTMQSSFEETKQYVLTALGEQFVQYVMEDVVPQLGAH